MGRATNFDCCYIYHIVDKEGIVHYVGSTSNFNSRKSKHKHICTHEHCNEYNFDIYKYIREHGDWDAFEMVPIRKIENISNKTELRIVENDEMKKFTGLKNMRGSYQTHEQKLECTRIWQQNNQGYNRKYYESNIEKIKETNRKYCENNAQKITEKNRKHREENREQYNAYHRKYRLHQKQLKSDQ